MDKVESKKNVKIKFLTLLFLFTFGSIIFIMYFCIKNSITKIIQTMKILVDIHDIKVPFGMEVLKSLSFVKRVKPMTNSAVKLWEDLSSAAQDVRLHKQGKLNLKTAQDLLNEL